MAGLKIVSDRLDDNSLKFAIVLGPRRNGEVNFGAAEAINRALLMISPEAYDPDAAPSGGVSITTFPPSFVADEPVPHDVAAAMIRDRVIGSDDDLGAPGEPPRCATGVCDE